MTTNVNHPYFNAEEIAFLCDRQRGKMSESQESKARIQACAFIEVVGAKIGLFVYFYSVPNGAHVSSYPLARLSAVLGQQLLPHKPCFIAFTSSTHGKSSAITYVTQPHCLFSHILLTALVAGRYNGYTLRFEQNARHPEETT